MLPTLAEPFMPHTAPMTLIDEILACDAHSVVTQVTIHKDSLFLDAHNRVSAIVGIEYMAQSAAAWSGYNAQNSLGDKKPPVGMLLGTRDYSSHVPYFDLGDVLTIEALCLLQSEQGLGSFDCTLKRHNQVLATARLSVYQPQ
ncbi:MAG: 3-hydroxylacyl-ACP dehydratase [Formosimonas sp.]